MRASSLQRYALCPGSWALEQDAQLNEVPEPAICESGQAIHAYLAGYPIRELTIDEEDLAEQCWDEEATVLADLLGETPTEVVVEREMVLPTKPVPLTGHSDKILWFESQREVVVIDWKTGWLEVTNADRNLQLRAYVLGAKQMFPLAETITAAIIQPRVRGGALVAVYAKHHLREAWKEVEGIVKTATTATPADLYPSPDACKYCPVQAVCPAVLQEVQTLASADLSEARWSELPVPAKIDLWDRMKLAEGAIAALKEQFRADLEQDPDCYAGELALKPGNKVRCVSDPVGAFQAVHELGVSDTAFAACCKVGLSQLKEQIKEATGLKGKALNAALNDALEPYLTIQENQPSIERRHPTDSQS